MALILSNEFQKASWLLTLTSFINEVEFDTMSSLLLHDVKVKQIDAKKIILINNTFFILKHLMVNNLAQR